MAIYVFAHTKGGVTKSTSALNMTAMRAADSRRVCLVDADSGQSAMGFQNVRKLAGLPTNFEVVSLVSYLLDDGQQWFDIAEPIGRLAARFDDVIVDAGGEGHGSPEIRMALSIADRVITPCNTPTTDTARLAPMNTMIGEARILNPKLRAFLFPTRASTNARKSDVIDFYKNVARYRNYEVLETVVRHRDCYTKWQDTGEVLFEQKRPPKAALDEMAALYREVFA